MSIKIGSQTLKYGLMLAPMAGFSDRAMRRTCREYGAEYAISEMVSARALAFRDKKTARLARLEADELPAAIQLFGSEPDIMAEAAELIEGGAVGGAMPTAIDVNMGCPVPKIFNNGEGCALMRSPREAERIVYAISKRVRIPITVKLRLGTDASHLNVLDCARAVEAGGAALVTIHGRTRAQMYTGSAAYEEIVKVKQTLQIPVVANGDICSAEKALHVLEETGADGVMIGRGAIGNPFIFAEIAAAIGGVALPPPTLATRTETALRQLRRAIEDKGEAVAVREARGQIARYFTAFRGAAALRAAVNRAEGYAEIERALEELLIQNS